MIFVVDMKLKPVPKKVYLERGKAENEYTQQLMAKKVIVQFYVTKDHKNYWIVFSVADEKELEKTLQGFPFYEFFQYQYHECIDMVAAVKAGMRDPNLD